jgi:hypothetical protein
MISQVIEAKPEDLRAYLEEAAGISKYKERRKETETRIAHPREPRPPQRRARRSRTSSSSTSSARRKQAEQYQQLKAEQRDQGCASGRRWNTALDAATAGAARRADRRTKPGSKLSSPSSARPSPDRTGAQPAREAAAERLKQGAGRGLSRRRRDRAGRTADRSTSANCRAIAARARRLAALDACAGEIADQPQNWTPCSGEDVARQERCARPSCN